MSVRPVVLATLLLLAASLPGCLFANIQSPLDRDLDETSLGHKVGRSSWRSYLWAVAVGDAGTQAAAENGDITVIRHADEEIFSVLFGLYYVQTTIVYGD